MAGEVVRNEADYAGVRITLTASLITARIAFHVDVNFGDPVWPGPQITDVPLLLGGTIRLRGYPDHMVLAEKIVTAIDRGTANTRWRDFVDIATIIAGRSVKQDDLRTAIETVANYRRVRLVPIATILDGMAEVAQPKWEAWRRKQHLEGVTPERLQDLLDQCTAFNDGASATARPEPPGRRASARGSDRRLLDNHYPCWRRSLRHVGTESRRADAAANPSKRVTRRWQVPGLARVAAVLGAIGEPSARSAGCCGGARSNSRLAVRSHLHMVIKSFPTNRLKSQTGMGNRRGPRPVTERQISRHSAVD